MDNDLAKQLGDMRQDIGALLHGLANVENWTRDEMKARRELGARIEAHTADLSGAHGKEDRRMLFTDAIALLNLLILAGTLFVMYNQKGGVNENTVRNAAASKPGR